MYTVDYFINKFQEIPEENWCTQDFKIGSAMCANGHCGIFNEFTVTEESQALKDLFLELPIHYLGNGYLIEEPLAKYSTKATIVNDGRTEEYRQLTPKQRILAALYDIKKLQSPEVKEKIVYVAVPVTITEQAKELVLS